MVIEGGAAACTVIVRSSDSILQAFADFTDRTPPDVKEYGRLDVTFGFDLWPCSYIAQWESVCSEVDGAAAVRGKVKWIDSLCVHSMCVYSQHSSVYMSICRMASPIMQKKLKRSALYMHTPPVKVNCCLFSALKTHTVHAEYTSAQDNFVALQLQFIKTCEVHGTITCTRDSTLLSYHM